MPALQKILKGMVCSEKDATVSAKRTQETVRFDERNRLTDKGWKKKESVMSNTVDEQNTNMDGERKEQICSK